VGPAKCEALRSREQYRRNPGHSILGAAGRVRGVPSASTDVPERVDYAQRLATKYRTTPDEAHAMIDRVSAVCRSSCSTTGTPRIRGRFDIARPFGWR
jgi:hypothetical protein